jgi:hypothetical protein
MLIVITFNNNINTLGWLKHQTVLERNTTVGKGTPQTLPSQTSMAVLPKASV